MHENQNLTFGRVARVLEERLRPAIYSQPHSLDIASHAVGGEPIPVEDGLAAVYEPIGVGAWWGRAWDTTWLRITGTVPAEFIGRRVEVVADLGFDVNMPGFQAEGLVYLADKTPVRSLNPRAQWIPVSRKADGGETIEFFIEAASNPVMLDYKPFLPSEQGDSSTSSPEKLYRIRRIDVCVFEEEVFELVHDVEVLLQLAQQLPEQSTRRARILHALDGCLNRVDLQDVVSTATAARAQLREVLSAPAESSAHRLTAIGHAHIDSAWLWPLRETVRKVARTASSMVTLLDDDDDFIYAMSSAQQYDWLKKQRPEVFERVKKAVASGRFVPIGGMWVEPDAVLPAGESFIRQISYGQRFFREEFGIECAGAWLPDSFGYSGSLPQLLTGAGFTWFLTQKISWNQVNVFPHHSFLWEGIDGSRIFTHFPPMDTYNSQLSGEEVARASRQFKEKAVASSSLAPVGWGDGGGGTTREMIARGKRMADLEGSARVVFESPDDFFARAMEELPTPDVWRGELYLELHRGTFTTQHKTKQGNRRSEQLLYEAELWGAAASVRAGYDFPYDQVDELWREVLLLQFHDILPGTSIAWVHREAEERYREIARQLETIIADALAILGVQLEIGTNDPLDAGASRQRMLVNSAPVAWNGAPAASVAGAHPAARTGARREGDRFVLESEHVRVTIDRNGHVVSAVDKAQDRDVVPAGGRGNLLQIHQDFPNMWDAWDVDAHYFEMREDLGSGADVSIDDDGAVVVSLRFGESSIEQRLFLGEDGRILLIDNTVEWAETEKFLKLAFPVDVFADHAVAETQFGHHSRTTHANTSWEKARFETQAQRWFLVEEPGFGVAFINDSSHGFDVTRVETDGHISQLARFSMLRSPKFPDPQTDRGSQTMRFGVLIGANVASATEAGWRLNTPARVASGASVAPVVSSGNPAVIVSAVKLADDRSGDLIVRLYESGGSRGRSLLSFDLPGTVTVTRVDLLERATTADPLVLTAADPGWTTEMTLRPFEVTTLRIRRS